jgi:excisionase family DNA binding protein
LGVKPPKNADEQQRQAVPRFYTVNETAAMLRTSPITMYRAINDGEFPAVRVRGRLIVPAKVIDALIDTAIESYSLTDPADWVRDVAPAGSSRRRSRHQGVRPRPGANQTGAGSPVTQQGARGDVPTMPDSDWLDVQGASPDGSLTTGGAA